MIAPFIVFSKEKKEFGTLSSNDDFKIYCGKSLIPKNGKLKWNYELIDSQGKVYQVKELHSTNNVNWILSIRNFSKMIEVTPIIDGEPGKITLEELKDKIYERVQKNKAFWGPLNDGRGLKRMIYETKDFKELIRMFR